MPCIWQGVSIFVAASLPGFQHRQSYGHLMETYPNAGGMSKYERVAFSCDVWIWLNKGELIHPMMPISMNWGSVLSAVQVKKKLSPSESRVGALKTKATRGVGRNVQHILYEREGEYQTPWSI